MQSKTITVTVTKNATANISLCGAAFTWSNVQDNTSQFLASDGGNITVTGTLITKIGSGAGSIAISFPGQNHRYGRRYPSHQRAVDHLCWNGECRPDFRHGANRARCKLQHQLRDLRRQLQHGDQPYDGHVFR